jgi:hypothetical protein
MEIAVRRALQTAAAQQTAASGASCRPKYQRVWYISLSLSLSLALSLSNQNSIVDRSPNKSRLSSRDPKQRPLSANAFVRSSRHGKLIQVNIKTTTDRYSRLY